MGLFHTEWRGLKESGYYLFGILGDGVAVFYLVGACFFLQKSKLGITGLFASLAVLSKPYLLFFPVCFSLVLFFQCYQKKLSWEKGIAGMIGLAVPFCLLGAWLVLELGAPEAFRLLVFFLEWLKKKVQFFPVWSEKRLLYAFAGFLGFAFCFFGLKVSKEWKQQQSSWEACPFCGQLEIQKYWKNLGDLSAAERPLIWTTSKTYARDLDYLLSAPFRKRDWDPLQFPKNRIKPQGLQAENWIIIGEDPNPEALQFVETNACQPVKVLAGTRKGFWRCDESQVQ